MTCRFCDRVQFYTELNEKLSKLSGLKAGYFALALIFRNQGGRVNLGEYKPKYCPVCGKKLWRKSPKQTNIPDLEGWPFEQEESKP